MVYKVKLFALLKERVGSAVWEWDSPQPKKGSELLARFFADHPDLAGMGGVTRLAVNQSFRTDDPILQDSDELALIPPVSGG